MRIWFFTAGSIWLLLVFLLFFVSEAQAAEIEYWQTANPSADPIICATPETRGYTDQLSYCQLYPTDPDTTGNIHNAVTVWTAPNGSYGCEVTHTEGSGSHNWTIPDPSTVDCTALPPSNDPCAYLAGLPASVSYQKGDTFSCTDSGGNSCGVSSSGAHTCTGNSCFGEVTFSGTSCSTPDIETGEESKTNCVTSGGVTVCSTPNAENCGKVNGEFVCYDSVVAGDCVITDSGAALCVSSASSPPAPTTPDGLSKATADTVIDFDSPATGDIDIDYYSSSTVAASGTAVTGEGEGGTGSSASGEDLEDSEGVDSGELPALEETASEVDIVADFMARVQASPIYQATAGVSFVLPAGVCPTPSATLDFISTTITMDAHCSLWNDVKEVISAVMLAIYAFIGIRIILEA